MRVVSSVLLVENKNVPIQTLNFLGGWDSHISRQTAYEGGKVVSPKHRPPLAAGNIP
jgi:hypothetical protein